ncbi:hypothetical protein [Actinoallomurus sp. NPDC052274]|uniref:hypothetical protein n=1 Tax=Actinoallomurus sp. NPDC052274 TaxID=3155420 RepID=UPI00342F988C
MTKPRPHRHTPTCSECGEPIIWAITQAGAKQPLNPRPDLDGSVLAYKDALGAWRSRSLSAISDDTPRHPLERPYMPHAATCTPRPAPAPAPKPGRAAPPSPLPGSNVRPFRRRPRG